MWWKALAVKIHILSIVVSWALRAIPKKEEVRSEIEEKDKDRELEIRPKDNTMEQAKREIVELLTKPLATQVTLPDDDNIIVKAIDMMDSVAIIVTFFL